MNASSNGYLGPPSTEKQRGSESLAWSIFRFITDMTLYGDAEPTDARVVPAMFRLVRRLQEDLRSVPLTDPWAVSRWQEAFFGLQWLLDRSPNATVEDVAATMSLMDTLRVQGFNWTGWFKSSPTAPFLPPSPSPLPSNGTCVWGENLYGDDLRMSKLSPGAGESDCRAQCVADTRCSAFVFQNCTNSSHPGVFCWLKKGIPSLRKPTTPGCSLCSAIVRSSPSPLGPRPWLPVNSTDADAICGSSWKEVDRQWTHGWVAGYG